MFTGLIQTTGKLLERAPRGAGFRVAVSAAQGPLELGESIAVSGVCLTVAEVLVGGFVADLSAETVLRSTLGRVPVGTGLNLERSLRAGDRLGGHFVSGHVDSVATIEGVWNLDGDRKLSIRPPAELLRYLAPKGSVALDGVSLTINSNRGAAFEVMLIPHTLSVTTLNSLKEGSEVNLEIDILARYAVHSMASTHFSEAGSENSWIGRNSENGGWLR